MAEALREKIGQKSAISLQRGQVEGRRGRPYQSFLHGLVNECLIYNCHCVADSFHTKQLCSRLSLSEVRFSKENGSFAFLRPPLGGLGATYDDHLRPYRSVILILELFDCVPGARLYK